MSAGSEGARHRTVHWDDPAPSAAVATRVTGLAFLEGIRDGMLPSPPIARLLGFTLTEVEPGRSVFECEPSESQYNPIGSVHGGYAATLLDSVLGCAVHTTLDAGVGYTTAGLEVKFMRPITREVERVRATGEVTYRGRRQATAQGRLTDVSGERLFASATTTCMILS